MEFDLKKFIDLCENNYKEDIEKKLIEKVYEEIEKSFNNILPSKIAEFMSEAIDEFYSFPKGKVYDRTYSFFIGRGLYEFVISNGGHLWKLNYGDGFPDYPSIKGVRKKPWPGDKAWIAMFDKGEHGGGRMKIGTTSPSPYEIVDEKVHKEIDNFIDQIVIEVKEKYLRQFQEELVKQYKNQCIS